MKHLILFVVCFFFLSHTTLWSQEIEKTKLVWQLEAGANNSFQHSYFPMQPLWTPNSFPTPCAFNNKSQFGGYLSGGVSNPVFHNFKFNIGLECVFTNMVSSGDRDSVIAYYYSTGFNYAWLVHRRYITTGLDLGFNYSIDDFVIHVGLGVPIFVYRNYEGEYTTGKEVSSEIVPLTQMRFPFVLLQAGIGYNITSAFELKLQYQYFTQHEIYYNRVFAVGLTYSITK